jgi:hypothetical protein
MKKEVKTEKVMEGLEFVITGKLALSAVRRQRRRLRLSVALQERRH